MPKRDPMKMPQRSVQLPARDWTWLEACAKSASRTEGRFVSVSEIVRRVVKAVRQEVKSKPLGGW